MNAVNPDIVLTLQHDPRLNILRAPGTVLAYLAFNTRDPILRDVRVRQAIAYAINRQPIVDYLLRGFAQPAASVLPAQSWAYDSQVPTYTHDPAKARQLLDAAGYPATNGVRFHLTMKTSNQEGTRLLVAVLQQQLRDVGIVLDIRTFEFATFYADVTHGLFQLYSMRWIGGNEDPDIFEYVFHSAKVPPKGANRGFYHSARVDALIDQARREVDQGTRKKLYAEIQQIVAEEVPAINLWYLDNVLICNRRVKNVSLGVSGDYNFLKGAEINSPDQITADTAPTETRTAAMP
jgi:peptide/nickel transport system substrate-binding protein